MDGYGHPRNTRIPWELHHVKPPPPGALPLSPSQWALQLPRVCHDEKQRGSTVVTKGVQQHHLKLQAYSTPRSVSTKDKERSMAVRYICYEVACIHGPLDG